MTETKMRGSMQHHPLLVSSLIAFAEREHGDAEIVSRTAGGAIFRYTYAEAASRARKLAKSLVAMGVYPGDRVATLAWNGFRHFEAYYAISGLGAVCHTINPRLFPRQIGYIIEDAAPVALLVDSELVGLLAEFPAGFPSVKAVIVMAGEDEMPKGLQFGSAQILCFESLMAGESQFAWPLLDESSAACLCYTSGTTGNPKGVLYTHRSIVLHTYAVCMKDAYGLGALDVVMPVVPMFHVMAWGIPYATTVTGAKLVLPGSALDGRSLHELIDREHITIAAGVPTVWMGLLEHLNTNGGELASLRRILSGGAAISPAIVEQFKLRHGVQVQHAWGMTELSPVGGINSPKPRTPGWQDEAYSKSQTRQGRPPFGIDIKAVGLDGRELERDGVSVGAIKARGHWVLSHYFGMENCRILDDDGWFETGDVGSIDRDGFLRIVDRSKDLIKSGGEWISSIELENLIVGHSEIAEAAVVAAPDPRWGERAALFCVRKPGASVTAEDIRNFYKGKVAKWWIPDRILFVEALPHTATGKLDKVGVRQMLASTAEAAREPNRY